jgi:hypothetical protein
MKKFILFVLLFIISVFIGNKKVYSQTTNTNEQRKKLIIVSPGLSLQKNFYAELNFTLADRSLIENFSESSSQFVVGPRIGVEIGNFNNKTIVAPKVGYEVAGMFFCLRGNLIYYMQQSNKDLRLMPEIGFSYLGFANLTYGYGLPILNSKIKDVRNSNIRLTFNLSKKILEFIKQL